MIAARNPQQSRCVPEALEATETLRELLEIRSGGQDALWADLAANLENEREECGKINESKRAEEKPARDEAVAVSVVWIEEPADRLCCAHAAIICGELHCHEFTRMNTDLF